jgi:hypothetical protein
LDEAGEASAIVVPHDVIAMQHGIAAVLHGFGCWLFCAGDSWCEPWCAITDAADSIDLPLS